MWSSFQIKLHPIRSQNDGKELALYKAEPNQVQSSFSESYQEWFISKELGVSCERLQVWPKDK